MAQKEDILEQIVEEYLTHEGYFVQHNIKFKPVKDDPEYVSQKDSVSSDIDVLAIHPRRVGHEKVVAVNVKSWQSGFIVERVLDEIEHNKKVRGRPAQLQYRELTMEKWARAYIGAVKQHAGTERFTYVLAVTLLKGDKLKWESHPPFRKALQGNPIKIITLKEMVERIETHLTRTPAATDIGRLLQLFLAAGLRTRSAPPMEIPDFSAD
jgi:Nuclease-related domain